MDSDSSYSSEYNTNQNNSGLLRFRSAPSSFFLDGVAEKSGKISDEISRFTSFEAGYRNNNNTQFSNGGLQFLEDKDNIKKATANNYASISSQVLPPQYPNPIPIPIPRPTTSEIPPSQLGSVNGGYGVNSRGMVGSSSLMRQNSSPAGLFSQNGYAKMRGIPSYAFSNGTTSNSSSIRDLDCSSGNGIPSSFGMLSRISEVENDEKIGTREQAQFYGSNFPLYGSNDSSSYSGNFPGLKREIDTDQGLFSDNQGGGEYPINQPPVLSHRMSLPKASAEIEKLMQFQDAVPCKIRAKRGCATHPRSIAERVRRTRISERMRKLQDLVPNMEKQTNTADMLDLAVEYIKDLQKQYKTLTDIRANCKCSSTENSV